MFHQALQNGEISKFIIPSVLIYLTFLLHFYSSGSVILKKPSFVSHLVILEISPYRKGRINAASSFLFMSYLNKELLSPAPSPSPKVTSKGFFFPIVSVCFQIVTFCIVYVFQSFFLMLKLSSLARGSPFKLAAIHILATLKVELTILQTAWQH